MALAHPIRGPGRAWLPWTLRLSVHRLATYTPDPVEATPPRTAASGGDLAAFEHFFRQFEGDIVGYLWRMTSDDQLARDLAQETFVRAWQHFANLSTYQQPRAWLFRVATNLAHNHVRRQSLRRVISLNAWQAPGSSDEPTAVEVALARPDHAHLIVEQESVRQALLALSPRDRAALILQGVYGLSCAELADVLGITLSNAKTTLCRARERFRGVYEKEAAR